MPNSREKNSTFVLLDAVEILEKLAVAMFLGALVGSKLFSRCKFHEPFAKLRQRIANSCEATSHLTGRFRNDRKWSCAVTHARKVRTNCHRRKPLCSLQRFSRSWISTILEELDRKCCNGTVSSHVPGSVLKQCS